MILGNFLTPGRIFRCSVILIVILQNFQTEAHHKRQKCGSEKSFQCGSGSCIDALLKCDGIPHCEDGSDETSAACSNTICPLYKFQCAYGGCVTISSICNGKYDCIDQSDEPPISNCRLPGFPKIPTGATKKPPTPKPTTLPTPPATTETIPVISGNCQLPATTEDQNYVINDCDSQPTGTYCNLRAGQYIDQFTTITLRCNPNYYSPIAENTTAFCLEEKWTPSIVHCEECGLTTTPGNTNDNYVPWLVAIYDSAQSYNICWGTLLSPFTVLTAAHCVFDSTSNAKKESSDFFVMAGKHLLSPDDEDGTKQYRIASITFINDAFDGAKSNYKANLAILEMDTKVSYTDFIKPVCVDWRNRINFRPNNGDQGFIPAWILNRQEAKGELRPQNSPYISNTDCRSRAPNSLKPLITDDKFCASLAPGTTIDSGNGGNGFYVSSPNRRNYHLLGIISSNNFRVGTEPPVLIITDFNKYILKIESVMNEIENRRKSDQLIDVRFPTEQGKKKKSN